MSIKLYVGGFSYGTTEEDLSKMFSEFGKILSVKVITDRDTGNSKGFGFVELSEPKEGQEAIKALNGKSANSGRTLVVNQAKAENRSRSPGYGGGFRR